MEIWLERWITPCPTTEGDCHICGDSFELKRIVAHATTGFPFAYLGVVCPSCLEYLSQHRPECCPSVEEYEAALRRYPKSVFASEAVAARAKQKRTYEQAWK